MPDPEPPKSRVTLAQLTDFIASHFPQVQEGNGPVTIEFISRRAAVVRMACDERNIRPGGTVHGPAMFKLADFAVYVSILGELGLGATQAVTTSMTINFLSRPVAADLVAHARLIKIGRRLAVAEVEIYSDGKPDMVAHATSTYALPPERPKA
jgi:uncharacterized protein (TIGR00369 family)